MAYYKLTHSRESGGMEGVLQTHVCTSAEDAAKFVRVYILQPWTLRELFWYGCKITAEVIEGNKRVGEPIDMLARVRLCADDLFEVTPTKDPKRTNMFGRVSRVLEAEKYVARFMKELKDCADSVLAPSPIGTAMNTLSFIDPESEWKQDEKTPEIWTMSPKYKADTLAWFKKIGAFDVITLDKLVLTIALPKLPPLGSPLLSTKKAEKLSEPWG